MKKPRLMAAHTAAAVCVFTFATVAAAGVIDPWAPPAGFYNSVSGTGATLKSSLFTRMSSGHTQRNYGNFRDSAALHDADVNNPGKLILVYNVASVNAAWDSGATWNREHVWPESRQPGSVSNSSTGNLGDPHALRPCNPSINSSRGNKPFGFENTFGVFGSQGSYYFPGDMHKGDVARCLMYSDTRWGPQIGISLVDTFPSGNQMGGLSAMVAWNYLDPPDEFERRRNHVIYSSALNPSFFTNNRNAYVDHPEFVWSIYRDQENDSQLYVGAGADVDGSSQTLVDFGEMLVGSPATIAQNVTLHRLGMDGTYFEVTALNGATSTIEGRYNAFPINVTGTDSRVIGVGLDGSAFSSAGLVMGQVVIDNLDVTTQFGAGRADNDGDDVIFVEAVALDHADGSFDDVSDVNTVMVDFGSISQGSGDAMLAVTIHNLEATASFTAGLDAELDAGASSGDTATITTSFVEALDIAPGAPVDAVFTLDDSTAGDFAAEYVIRVYDDRTLAGFAQGTPLVVQLIGTVIGCPGDVNGDNVVDTSDLGLLIAAFGSNTPAADFNGDLIVDTADLGILLANFGSDCN